MNKIKEGYLIHKIEQLECYYYIDNNYLEIERPLINGLKLRKFEYKNKKDLEKYLMKNYEY